jgi:hypothetical protein
MDFLGQGLSALKVDNDYRWLTIGLKVFIGNLSAGAVSLFQPLQWVCWEAEMPRRLQQIPPFLSFDTIVSHFPINEFYCNSQLWIKYSIWKEKNK